MVRNRRFGLFEERLRIGWEQLKDSDALIAAAQWYGLDPRWMPPWLIRAMRDLGIKAVRAAIEGKRLRIAPTKRGQKRRAFDLHFYWFELIQERVDSDVEPKRAIRDVLDELESRSRGDRDGDDIPNEHRMLFRSTVAKPSGVPKIPTFAALKKAYYEQLKLVKLGLISWPPKNGIYDHYWIDHQ